MGLMMKMYVSKEMGFTPSALNIDGCLLTSVLMFLGFMTTDAEYSNLDLA